jgi:TIR domain
MMEQKLQGWDLFICHASEDKAEFVKPLAAALSAFGVRVWYDDYALKLGDSLSRNIDQGLVKSDYGLVVLSPAFFAKKWPEYELRGLTARELSGSKVILPIWHNVSHQDVLAFSPPMADKIAVESHKSTPVQVALKVIETVRPDIFTRILRRLAYVENLAKAQTRDIVPSRIITGPIRHEKLPLDLVGRVRLIRASLLGAYPHSMAFWLDGFKRDAHPSKEIAFWERVAAVYNEYVAIAPPLIQEQHKQVFRVIFMLSVDDDQTALMKAAEGLPENALEMLQNLYSHVEPIYDIEERLASENTKEPSKEYLNYLETADTEHFPGDLPEELIRELMGTQESGAKR